MERQREVGLLGDSSGDTDGGQVTAQKGMLESYGNRYLAVAGCVCHLR